MAVIIYFICYLLFTGGGGVHIDICGLIFEKWYINLSFVIHSVINYTFFIFFICNEFLSFVIHWWGSIPEREP